MIQLIYASKGNGKTKRLLDLCTDASKHTDGSIVFIDDDKRYLREVPSSVRFVDISEYDIEDDEALYGFLCGMYAQNYDICEYFIDAFVKIVKKNPEDMESFFRKLERFSEDNNIKIVISVSAEVGNAPDFLRKYII